MEAHRLVAGLLDPPAPQGQVLQAAVEGGRVAAVDPVGLELRQLLAHPLERQLHQQQAAQQQAQQQAQAQPEQPQLTLADVISGAA